VGYSLILPMWLNLIVETFATKVRSSSSTAPDWKTKMLLLQWLPSRGYCRFQAGLLLGMLRKLHCVILLLVFKPRYRGSCLFWSISYLLFVFSALHFHFHLLLGSPCLLIFLFPHNPFPNLVRREREIERERDLKVI